MTGPVIEVADPATGEVVTFDGLQVLIPGDLTPTSYRPPAGLTFDQWSAIGAQLQPVAASINWWLGDWMLYGEGNFAQKSAQAAEATGRAPQTLLNARWVASKLPVPYRREGLAWHHHAAAAGLPTEEADEVLAEAERQGWDVRDVREEVARRKGRPFPTDASHPSADISRDLERWLAEGGRLAAAVGGGAVFVALPDAATIDAVADLLAVLDPRRRQAA